MTVLDPCRALPVDVQEVVARLLPGRRLVRGCVLLAVIMITSLLPASAWAVAPTVTNNTLTLATGVKKTVYLYPYTTWTGSVFTLTYTILQKPQHGTITQPYTTATYYCFYQADQVGYTGPDSFTWCASKGSETSGVATCSIIIVTNSAPVAGPVAVTARSGKLAAVYLSSYVTHALADYGQTLTYMICSEPANGTITFDPASGRVYYTSAPGFMGTDTFTWAVSDGMSASAPGTVTVTVLGNPPVTMDQSVVVPKNTPTIIHPLFTGGEGFTCSLVKLGGPSHGTLTVTNRTWFHFKPVSNYVGSDSFKWQIAYSNEATPMATTTVVTCSIAIKDAVTNADWTQWRFDETRSAKSAILLPDELHLLWRRDLPTCPPSFGAIGGIDYCRPVQLGKNLFVSLMANDSVSAYDTDTGAQKWRYYTSGALRRPPVALALANGTNVVIAGCDDGYVYCLNAANGSEVWKFHAAPNARKAIGAGRLGSAWPLWASPVAYGGKVYFAAGCIPMFGLYVYCLDAATGTVLWRNDGQMIKDGMSALGPLALSSDHTKIYGSRLRYAPWALNAATGARITGLSGGGEEVSWFVDGNGAFSSYEEMKITAGGYTFVPENVAALGVQGTVASMLAGDGKLFVTTTNGCIYCFGGAQATPTVYPKEVTPLPDIADGWTAAAQSILSRPDLKQGLALVWGVGSGRLVEELAKQAPNLLIVAADPDPAQLRALRVKMDAAGLSGVRVSTVPGNPMECGFAPYQATIIASEDVGVAGWANGQSMVQMLYECTRPFGGEVWLPTTGAQHSTIAGWIAGATNMPLCEVARQSGFIGIGADGFTQIKRTGLSDEKAVFKPPFGLTVLSSASSVSAVPLDYYCFPTNGAVNGRDVYTWLPAPAPMPGHEPAPSNNNVQLGKTYSFPMNGTMLNTLYSDVEKGISVSVSAACDGARQYGSQRLHFGKVAAFGNPSPYWGAMYFPEMGGCCTPMGYIGDGVIALGSSGYKNCNSLALKLAMMNLAPIDGEENWVNYRSLLSTKQIQETPVRRVGVNLGGVGDWFVAEEEMLWTHHPYVNRGGEARPLLAVTYRGNVKNVYHHSAQIYGALRAVQRTGERYRGWVSASQVTGMDGLTVNLGMQLVALRTETPPTLDNQLTEDCWDDRGKVSLPVPLTGCDDSCYILLRYDDVNLYMGAVVRGHASGTGLKAVLNSREQVEAPLTVQTNMWRNGLSGTNELRSAELAIPWASIEAAGMWKEQLIASVTILGDYGGTFAYVFGNNGNTCYGPVYLNAARGAMALQKPHTVRLYFAEMEDKPAGQRVFNVKMQGQTVLEGLDVAAAAGGPRRELVREFSNVQIADKLNLDFERTAGEPMLSGVEIMAAYSDTDLANVSPAAVIDASAVSGTAPLEVILSARKSYDPDGQVMECAWETGDGRLARGSVLRHVFAEPGTYKVNLMVLDNRGKTAATNVVVTVNEGIPASFVCKIRAGGGDYTNLVTWESAIESDLTSSSTIFQVSSAGTYASGDNAKAVVFSGGATGKLRWLDTNCAPVIAAVANVGGTGTVEIGVVTISGGHTFTISDTGAAVRSLLFRLSARGDYAPATDDGRAVTFSGGGKGILKHINTANIAYITECRGTTGTGIVTCASGHRFSVAGTGNPIYTAVAECYNDWTNGLRGEVKIAGWITDGNHCVTVRTAPGHGHTGRLKDAGGKYTGFTIVPTYSFDSGSTPYTRMERIALSSGNIVAGGGGSVNRVCSGVSAFGDDVVVANSAGSTFGIVQYPNNIAFYNCSGQTFGYAAARGVRLVNCLAMSGFSNGSCLSYRGYCVSSNGTATNFYLAEQALDGNMANQVASLADPSKGDYHLAAGDTGARGLGQPGLGADIDGDERVGPDYDVGADQTYGNHSPRILNGPAAAPNAVGTGAVVRFTVQANDLDGDSLVYTWVFGDGDGTYGTNVTHVYAATGTYTARVAVTDGQLATTGTVVVTVLGTFDAWLVEHFGSTNAVHGGANDDADGDGLSNAQEFLAGTDPLDPGSALALTNIQPEPGDGKVVLQWRSESNKWYWIGKSTNLMAGFQPLLSNIPATYPLNTRTVDVGNAEGGFFVIRLEQ